MILVNRNAKCTIPSEVLEFFAQTILPNIIDFFETEEGNRKYEECLKEEETREKSQKNIKFGE